MLAQTGFPDTDAPPILLAIFLTPAKLAELEWLELFNESFVVLELVEEELGRFSSFWINYQKLLDKGDQHGAVSHIFVQLLHFFN